MHALNLLLSPHAKRNNQIDWFVYGKICLICFVTIYIKKIVDTDLLCHSVIFEFIYKYATDSTSMFFFLLFNKCTTTSL